MKDNVFNVFKALTIYLDKKPVCHITTTFKWGKSGQDKITGCKITNVSWGKGAGLKLCQLLVESPKHL